MLATTPVQNQLSSYLLFKNLNTEIYRPIIPPAALQRKVKVVPVLF
jgi:hypothetical protein